LLDLIDISAKFSPGEIREKMIIAYYRYKGAATIQHMDEVVRLCRNTGFKASLPAAKRPLNYPEEYFARFKLPADVISLILSKLRADDIYNHTSAFPSPQHRSIALAAQSTLLYVILYFQPDILHKKDSIMREIVDKHFPDNWVITVHMGYAVDLSEQWAPYKSASNALKNVFTKTNIEENCKKHGVAVTKLNVELEKLLTEGVLIEDFALENVRKLTQTVRECNFTLRWLILHRTTQQKKYKEFISSVASTAELLKLTLNTAQFEFLLKSLLKKILDHKQEQWNLYRNDVAERMKELSTFFSGEKELSRIKKNQSLLDWFNNLAQEVTSLDFSNSILAGRKITTLISALEEVEGFHQIDNSLQIKQFLAESRELLSKMIRIVNVNHKLLADLEIISDFSYSYEIINDYTVLMHEKIKQNPSVCLLLRATFLKLASILSLPLVRISQANSADDISVADYYSTQLVSYVRTVLDIIPLSVFQILAQIITLQSNKMQVLPTKLERKYLKDFAQLDERYLLAKLTHQVSVFTQGILAMNTTLVGIIKLDPRLLLEDGIRKQLVKQNATALNDFLQFNAKRDKNSTEEFEQKITLLGKKLDGFRLSFEYIQDYIGLYGLKIWQEEFSRIIAYNVEQECNSFLKQKIYDWQSNYQSDTIPIPIFSPIVPKDKNIAQSINFMGRLARELLQQTDTKLTIYSEQGMAWYDNNNSREIIGIRTFSLLQRGVGIFGLTGLDKLLCFMCVKELSDLVKSIRTLCNKQVKDFLANLTNNLHPTQQFPANTQQLYGQAISKTSKLLASLLENISKVGQIQLLRRQISNELNFSAKLDSSLLSGALENMNLALKNQVELHYQQPGEVPYPANPIIPSIAEYLESTGINNPLSKIYITTEPLEYLALLLFLFTLQHVRLLSWHEKFSTLTCTNKNIGLDGASFCTGIITLLKQFHSVHTHNYISYLGQFVRSLISANETVSTSSNKLSSNLPAEVISVLLFLEELCKFSHIPRSAIESVLPSYIFHRFPHTADK
jgi:WASH complex subunit strumpellin